MDWETIIEHIENKRLDLFMRTKEDEEFYLNNMAKLRSEYGSVSNYIKEVKLQPLYELIEKEGDKVICETGEVNLKDLIYYIEPQPKIKDNKRPQVLFVENDFKYDLNESIEHYLIWTIEEWCDPKQIYCYLTNKLPAREFVFFLNPDHLRSVKDIFHLHVFARKLN